MSFSRRTKNELSRLVVNKPCCQLAELSALVRFGGIIQLSSGRRLALNIVTENAAVARRVFTMLKKVLGIPVEIAVRKKTRLRKNNSYLVRIPPQADVGEVLSKLKILGEENSLDLKLKTDFLKNKCCRRAFLRGAFLGCGSLSDPVKANHLELVVEDSDNAEQLKELINSFGLQAKTVKRKNKWIVYLKDGEEIVIFLNLIKAYSALLNYENIRIVKDVRNNVNRIVNCETANLTKMVNAAVRQIEVINWIKDHVGLDYLPPNLKELAEIRLQYPEKSLKELGEMLDRPIGKSGVNHRMRRIEEIAEELKGRKK